MAVMLRCATNVQVCDARFMVSYLVKYVAGKEVRKTPHFKSGSNSGEIIAEVSSSAAPNEKISGVKYHEDQKRLSDNKTNNNFMNLSQHEVCSFNADEKCTHSNADFSHVCTTPPETRRSKLKKNTNNNNNQIFYNFNPNLKRQHLPSWRKFSRYQLQHAIEYKLSSLNINGLIEKFNIRPPELMIFSNPVIFSQVFVNVGRLNDNNFRQDILIENSLFLDAFDFKYLIREKSLKIGYDFLLSDNNNFESKEHLLRLFTSLMNSEANIIARFLHKSESVIHVPVPSHVHPSQKLKFLYHIIMTMGCISTELETFRSNDLLDAFRVAKIFQTGDNPRETVNKILKNLILKEYCFLPISAQKFCKCMTMAKNCLQDFFMNNSLNYSSPSISEHLIRCEVNNKINEVLQAKKITLVRTLHHKLEGKINLPSISELLDCTRENPLDWTPVLQKDQDQNEESFSEQCEALNLIMNRIMMQKEGLHPKNACLVGPPGSGKTYLTHVAALFAVSQGLMVMTSALAAEQALLSGGTHIHSLFNIQVDQKMYCHPTIDATNCIRNLIKNEISCVLLNQIDIFIFQEIGLISSENHSIMDNAMKYLMSNDLSMGGKLIIADGDPYQLSPITGNLIWMSTHLLFSFDIFMLKHYVRSSSDLVLQSILEIMRKSEVTDDDVKYISQCIERHCHFVDSWDDLPDHVIRTVSKKRGKNKVINDCVSKMKNNPQIRCVDSNSFDQVQQGDSWIQTNSRKVVKLLNKQLHEPEELTLYKGAIVCLTFNNTSSVSSATFSQGQLAIINDIPEDFVPLESSINISIVPPGERDVSVVNPNWPRMDIKARESVSVVVGSNCLLGRRIQYPFSHFFCSTIHKSVGQTLPEVGIQLSNNEDFKIWERMQFTVEISRTRFLQNIWFVGDRSNILNELRAVFDIKDLHIEKVIERIESLCINATSDSPRYFSHESMLTLLTTSYTPPEHGFIYHVVCKSKPYLSFIRSTTMRLENQIREDNANRGIIKSGGDCLEACGFIHGFSSNNERISLEKMFANQTQIDHKYQTLHSPWSIQEKMKDFVCNYNEENNCNLHFSKTAVLNVELVECAAIEDCKCLVDKENDYFFLH